MTIPPSFVCRQTSYGRLKVRPNGFSMLEILVVVGVMTLMVGLVLGSTGAINGTQGMTAVQQVTAMCDLARARSMRGEGTVLLAFANGDNGPVGEPYRSAIICAEDLTTEEPDDYVPISEWYHLPAGYVFCKVAPAAAEAGVNALIVPNAERLIKLSGNSSLAGLPSIGFGSLGEVVFPEQDSTESESLLIAVAEGQATRDGPRSKSGGDHRPEECRWLALRRNSGSPMILP